MKNIITYTIAFSLLSNAYAQSKNPANGKEVQDKIKQAQQQLDKLTPEQKKLMEQMGMSTKVPSMPAGVTDADIKTAVSGGSAFDVPSKNAGLIAAIPKIVLTTSTAPAYIKTLNDFLEKTIPNDARFIGKNVYSYYKQNKLGTAAIGNEAIAFWTVGRLEIAVYIMGKVCADDPNDADLTSNFAAMLSMGGAPHRAIPLLEYLNRQYPDNSTILNNLGQAWFYLGETDKADQNLERAVRIFANHPQANYTQCLIQQSKGNTAKAVEKMKSSLAFSYSLDKINMLRKLGYKVKGSDMRKPFRPDPNPLGLRNFVRPDVPTSYTEEKRLKADWETFQRQCNDKSMALAKELIPYQKSFASISSTPAPDNLYRSVADKNLEDMNKDGGSAFRLKKAQAQIEALMKDFQAKDEAQRKALERQSSIIADKETELAKKGENIGYNNCTVQEKYSEWVYKNYNQPLEDAYKDYLHQLYLKITEELYWKQFTMNESLFEVAKITGKKEWLAALASTRYIATDRYGKCEIPENKGSRYKLADFDDMHCAFKSTLDFKVYKQIVECGRMRVEFDAGGLSGNVNFKSNDKGKDEFIKATVEAAIERGGSIGKGPLQAGASVKAGMGMELSSRGVEDVYLTGEASVSAGSSVGDANLTISASGRMSLISGNVSGGINGFGK
jgi:tetratricopeptide (TPR) repeat protein